MKDFLIGTGICIGVATIGALFCAGLVFSPWVFEYAGVQMRNAEAWSCEKQGGEMKWQKYADVDKWHTVCWPPL